MIDRDERMSLSQFVESSNRDPVSEPPSRQNRRLGPAAKLGPRRISTLVDGSDIERLNIDRVDSITINVITINVEEINYVDGDGETWSMKVIDNGVLEFTKNSDQSKLYLQGSITNPDP